MRKRNVKILKGIGILIVLLGVLYAVAVVVSSIKLRRAYTDLEKAGRPMNPARIIPATIPDVDNAALLYKSAYLLLKAQPAPEKNLLEYLGDLCDKFMKDDLAPDQHNELQKLIRQESVGLALSLVEQGAQRRLCRFDQNYNAGFNILLTHLEIRHLSRILAAKVCLEAREGSAEGAWDSVPTQFRLADALVDEPVIISQLVRVRMIEQACRTIRKRCKIAPPTEQQTYEITNLLKHYDNVHPFVKAIDGERLLFGEWIFKIPKSQIINEHDILDWPDDFLGIVKIYFKPIFLADHATYLRMMLKLAQGFGHPDAHKEMHALEERLDTVVKRYPMSYKLIPAMSRVKQIHSGMLAELRIVRTGLTLLQYKQTKDAFPATLEALQLSDIKDPYSDGPILYRTEGDGFVLYSVGIDRKDNGGSPKQDEQKENWDIVWQYPGK